MVFDGPLSKNQDDRQSLGHTPLTLTSSLAAQVPVYLGRRQSRLSDVSLLPTTTQLNVDRQTPSPFAVTQNDLEHTPVSFHELQCSLACGQVYPGLTTWLTITVYL